MSREQSSFRYFAEFQTPLRIPMNDSLVSISGRVLLREKHLYRRANQSKQKTHEESHGNYCLQDEGI